MHEDTKALLKVTQLVELEGELHCPDSSVKAIITLAFELFPLPKFQFITRRFGPSATTSFWTNLNGFVPYQ